MPPTRVIKFGGSLLDAPSAFQSIPKWIDSQPAMHNVWVVGGGKLVDALRRLHQQFVLDEADSHWLAVDLLTVTAKIFADQFPDWLLCNSLADLQRYCDHAEPHDCVFICEPWLRSKTWVPETWDVTTDSIAALLAADLNAAELCLLKSTDPPPDWDSNDLDVLSQSEVCDPYFPQAAESVNSVRVVNFRDYS